MLFFCNFLLLVGQERNGMIIFIFSLSQSFLTYFGLKWSCNGIFQFFEFFCYFFGIYNYGSGRNWSEQNFLFSLFLSLSQPILTWKEALRVFYNFLNFFAIFLEFYITCRARINWNDNFSFFSFSDFLNLFWLEEKP